MVGWAANGSCPQLAAITYTQQSSLSDDGNLEVCLFSVFASRLKVS
jgi:hypothetical protein